jgi:hypothetical protein
VIELLLVQQTSAVKLRAHADEVHHTHLVLSAVQAEREQSIRLRVVEAEVATIDDPLEETEIEQSRP